MFHLYNLLLFSPCQIDICTLLVSTDLALGFSFLLCRFCSILSMPIIRYLLTYSMVQSPSWEANWFAASQEIPCISRNPKVHYHTHKRPPTVSILGQPNPVHVPTSWRSVLTSTHLRLSLPSGLLPSGFPSKTLYTPSPHPYAPHAQPISFFSILSPAQYWVRSTNHLAPRYVISFIPPLPLPS